MIKISFFDGIKISLLQTYTDLEASRVFAEASRVFAN